MDPVNPKVTAGAVGGAVGGGAAAVILIWLLQDSFGIPESSFTAERVVALTAIISGIFSFLSGWLKTHGVQISRENGGV